MFGNFNYNMGNEYFQSGDYKTAIKKFNKAIQSGDLDETDIYMAYLNLGMSYVSISDNDEAITALQSALQWGNVCENKGYQFISTGNQLVYCFLGKAYFGKKNYEMSLQYFEKSIALKSDNFEAWRFKGSALLCLNRNDEAETALNTALRYTDSPDTENIDLVYMQLYLINLSKKDKKSTELQKNGKFADAISVYDSILDIDSNAYPDLADYVNAIQANSLLNKGICLKALKRYDSAIGVLKKLIDLFPDRTDAYTELADCYTQLKEFDEALEYYTKAENCSEDDEEKFKLNIAKKITIIVKLWSIKDYQAALTEANSMSEENDILKFLKKAFTGICHFYLENYDEALNCLMPYVDADWIDSDTEDNSMRGMVYTYVGGVYYKRKNYETALKYLKKCVEIDYNDIADTGLFMGESYIALGEYEKAIDALRKAIDAWEETDNYDIPYLESRIQFAKDKLAEEKSKLPPSHITINGNNNPINLGGILATDDAVINRSVIGKDSDQEEPEFCFCPKCGTKVGAEDTFCRKCGEKLN